MFKIVIHDDAFEELSELPQQLKGKMFHLITKLEERGTQLRMPDSKPFGGGLFELRATERNNIARCIYAYQKEQVIFLLYAFVKKTQKTPAEALKTARTRLEEMLNNE